MNDHSSQPLSAREMVRAHAYPVLAALASFSLLALTILQIPTAVRNHRYNRCVDQQVQLRGTAHLQGQDGPGRLKYLMAVKHCEGL